MRLPKSCIRKESRIFQNIKYKYNWSMVRGQSAYKGPPQNGRISPWKNRDEKPVSEGKKLTQKGLKENSVNEKEEIVAEVANKGKSERCHGSQREKERQSFCGGSYS